MYRVTRLVHNVLLLFVSKALEHSLYGVSTMLQPLVTIFGCCGMLVRLILVAEEQLFTLVLFAPLQVYRKSYAT